MNKHDIICVPQASSPLILTKSLASAQQTWIKWASASSVRSSPSGQSKCTRSRGLSTSIRIRSVVARKVLRLAVFLVTTHSKREGSEAISSSSTHPMSPLKKCRSHGVVSQWHHRAPNQTRAFTVILWRMALSYLRIRTLSQVPSLAQLEHQHLTWEEEQILRWRHQLWGLTT